MLHSRLKSVIGWRLALVIAILMRRLASSDGEDKKPDLSKLPAASTTKVDFAKDIQPILARACVSCHGPAKQKGGLRSTAQPNSPGAAIPAPPSRGTHCTAG